MLKIRKVIFGIAVFLFCLVLLSFISELTSQNNTSKPSPTNTTSPSSTPALTIEKKIGESFTFGNLEFTVDSIDFGNYLNSESKKELQVYVTARNITKQDEKIKNYTFNVIFDGDYKYNRHGSWYELESQEIIPLEAAKITLRYEVPNEVQTSPKSLVLYIGFNNTKKPEKIEIKLR